MAHFFPVKKPWFLQEQQQPQPQPQSQPQQQQQPQPQPQQQQQQQQEEEDSSSNRYFITMLKDGRGTATLSTNGHSGIVIQQRAPSPEFMLLEYERMVAEEKAASLIIDLTLDDLEDAGSPSDIIDLTLDDLEDAGPSIQKRVSKPPCFFSDGNFLADGRSYEGGSTKKRYY
jgi:hypothetical protein